MYPIILFLLHTFAIQSVSAVPPACLLQAVNTQNQPVDLSAVCGDGALTVQSYMASNCNAAEEEAQKQFIATCSSAGTSVAAYTATTISSSSTATNTSTITSANISSGSATSTAGSAQSTAGANLCHREGMGPMAVAVIALVRAVAAL